MTIFKQISGSRRLVRRIRSFNGTSWDEITQVQNVIGGNQVTTHQTSVIDISTETDYNLFTATGSPTDPRTILVHVGRIAGTGCISSDTSIPAFDTGTGWHPDTRLILILYPNRYIVGRGGDGGDGAACTGATATCYAAAAGGAGGNAIYLQHDLEVINHGIIGGGGGGGGGGGAASAGTGLDRGNTGGGGGGGGAGYSTAGSGGTASGAISCNQSGNVGFNGSLDSAGLGGSGNFCSVGAGQAFGGAGAAGGGLGEAGSTGSNGVLVGSGECTSNGAAGGAAGKAVEPNGYTLTLINNGNVYGATS